ncbi:hypothetical protein B0H17DRAFT_231775 [Mycena rosella]|uniref:F-box domain-containing protein n=1 Tax=Mycena rosella TaxID=1033263 RepID=A0AAD7H1D0_MYCRO|nr:hypothetical protein B0H17DRAFT_231775 [Mycena rosella]
MFRGRGRGEESHKLSRDTHFSYPQTRPHRGAMPPRKKGKVIGKKVKDLVLAFPTSSKGFPALPLDILFEIFSHLHPLDLLHLTRTTKPFRRFLLNRANAAIWRDAFANSASEGGPPGIPSYMTEPAWARVAFEKTCHVCLAALRESPDIDSVWWEFGARYCGDCMGSQVSSTVSVKLKRLDPKRSNWESLLPRVPRGQFLQRYYYLVAHQREMIDAFTATEDTELRQAIVSKRAEQTRLVMQHSELCRAWAKAQMESRRQQAEARRREAENRRRTKELKQEATKEARVQAVVTKLKAVGWSDEPWMTFGTLASHIRHYPAVDVAQPLAPRAYRDLEPALLLRLTTEKRAAVLRQRIKVFAEAFPLMLDPAEPKNPAGGLLPRIVDVALAPAVRALLEEKGDGQVSQQQLVSTLRPVMPGLLQRWVKDAEARTSVHAGELLGLESENAVDPLSLAIAYVHCPRSGCGRGGYFPTLCGHPCIMARQLWASYANSDANSYEQLAEQCAGEKPYSPTVLRFGAGLRGLEGVVRAYGRDPKTATFREMAGERRLVSCGRCRETHPSMDWLAAMEHSTKFHNRPRDPEIVWTFREEKRDSNVEV